MTAADKPSYFGGALRGTFNIDPAATTVVDLNDNETLFFVPTLGTGGGATLTNNWVIAGYSGSIVVPAHWLPVASRQSTAANSTIQVLVGGVQYALRAGEVRAFTTNDAALVSLQQKGSITHKGLKFCRWTAAGLFTGTAANGATTLPEGVYVSWNDNDLMYSIETGVIAYGNTYAWLNVPTAGYNIPVLDNAAGAALTRVVKTIGAHRYVPLAPWEGLYWIPPNAIGGTTSVDGDWVIGTYVRNGALPIGAVLVARVEAAQTNATGLGVGKNRVKFADGTYMQPGLARPASVAAEVENDHAQGTGDWRAVNVAGSTAPGMTAAMAAVVGIQGPYGSGYTPQARYLANDSDPRGQIELRGLIQMNANVTTSNAVVAFIPGVQVYGNPIVQGMLMASTRADDQMIPVHLRFAAATVQGSQGTSIMIQANSANPANNPYFTLNLNGGTQAAGVSQWLSLDHIILPHA